MLMKVKDGVASSMFHEGVKYYFNKGEVKDCPPNMLDAFRGVLVQAEPIKEFFPRLIKMPIIQVNTETNDKKVIIKKTAKKKKK